MGTSFRRESALLCRAWGVALALLCEPLAAGADVPNELLIRLRSTGPHAVTECAESLGRRGVPIATATRDGSDSLDRLNREQGVREMRAVFRRPDGRSLARRRARQLGRAARTRLRLPGRTRAALPRVPDLSHVYKLRLRGGVDASAAAVSYAADPHVVWAQPNYAVVRDVEPNDPFFASSGAWGQTVRDLWGLLRVGAPSAWETTRGEGIVVAVVDTGIDATHPDLADNLWVNPGEDLDGNGRADASDRNGLDDDDNGFVDDLHGYDFANSVDANEDGDFDDPGDVADADPFDDNGHGTHVAGTVAAVADNGIGVVGVAPGARVMALKGFRQRGSSTIEVLARAMVYAAENGARVINNSWSCGSRCPSNPLAEEVVDFVTSLGVTVVTSAGNRADDVQFYSPENRRGTIVVAASQEDDAPAGFSNYGFLVDVTAPGTGDPRGPGHFPSRAILSLRSSGAIPGADGSGVFTIAEDYLRWSGTSMSSPHVAGVAALVLSAQPELTPDEVRAVLRASASDLGSFGHDRASGAGLVDAALAVVMPPPSVRAEFTSPTQGAVLDSRVGEVRLAGHLTGDVATALLSFGFGGDPDVWVPIPLAEPGADAGAGEARVLAHWDVGGLEDGPYVLRLEVRGGDGSRIEEFLLVSLERNPPTRVSSPGAAARSPALGRRLVAWESDRPAEGEEPSGVDLFVSDLLTGAEWRVVAAPGDQREPVWSGRSLVWLDGRSEHSELFRCRVAPRSRSCREVAVALGPALRTAPAASRDAIVWTEQREDLRFELRGCSPGPRGCPELALPDAPGIELDPSLSGRRLAWSNWSAGRPEVATCELSPDAPSCTPTAVVSLIGASAPTLDGPLLAWWFRGINSLLLACQLDPGTGTCPMQFLGRVGLDTRIAISSPRIVWDAPGPGGDRDIFFCEFDLHTDRCPIQRITGSAAEQRNPAIRGTRVAWEDDRDGVFAIFTLELPNLAPLRDRVVRTGRPLVVAVRGTDPSGGQLALDASFADGTPLEARGARFVDRGSGRGRLVWTPSAADLGLHSLTVEGVGSGRLATRSTFRIEVVSGEGSGPPRPIPGSR